MACRGRDRHSACSECVKARAIAIVRGGVCEARWARCNWMALKGSMMCSRLLSRGGGGGMRRPALHMCSLPLVEAEYIKGGQHRLTVDCVCFQCRGSAAEELKAMPRADTTLLSDSGRARCLADGCHAGYATVDVCRMLNWFQKNLLHKRILVHERD
jgi:hypothetical protein